MSGEPTVRALCGHDVEPEFVDYDGLCVVCSGIKHDEITQDCLPDPEDDDA